MSHKLEIEAGDVIFIMDTLKVLGNVLDGKGLDDVEDLLIESEGLLNEVLEAVYHEDSNDLTLGSHARYTAA